ncbi:MAG: cupin domain-containing protein [Armatimonadota bacterium]
MNTPLQSSSIVRAAEGIMADLGDHRSLVKVTAQDSNGAILFLHCEADFQGGVSAHIHRREDEIFYILSGRISFLVGDEVAEAGPGDTVFGPRNVVHSWRCVSPEGARLLITFTPGDNFQAYGFAMLENGIAPLTAMAAPALAEKFVAVAAQHGIEMLPPGDIK